MGCESVNSKACCTATLSEQRRWTKLNESTVGKRCQITDRWANRERIEAGRSIIRGRMCDCGWRNEFLFLQAQDLAAIKPQVLKQWLNKNSFVLISAQRMSS